MTERADRVVAGEGDVGYSERIDLEVVKEEKVGEVRDRSRDGVELVFLGGGMCGNM